jgi:hypothetical protein
MLLVITRFLHGLGGDGCKLGVAGLLQAPPQLAQPGGQQQVAQHGVGEVAPVAQRAFNEGEVAELALVAQEGQLVLVAAKHAARVREQRARLPQQVQRHIGQRDVLFQHRPVAAPFAQTLRVDQRAVGDAQQVFGVGAQHQRRVTCA